MITKLSGLAGFLMAAVVCLSATALPLQPLTKSSSSVPIADCGSGDSVCPVMSPDGRYVVFASRAGNLVTNLGLRMQPMVMNLYLRDRAMGQTTLISIGTNAIGGGNGDSFPVDISRDGRFVLFESSASNLISGDTNGASDVFVRDLVLGTNILVSAAG